MRFMVKLIVLDIIIVFFMTIIINNNNKHIYLQPHRVGFTYTVIYKQNKI